MGHTALRERIRRSSDLQFVCLAQFFMIEQPSVHFLTVGWDRSLIETLCDPVAARIQRRFTHLLHPRYTSQDWGSGARRSDVLFFHESSRPAMPLPDHELLASLERRGVPTVHNMIMSDRVVSKL